MKYLRRIAQVICVFRSQTTARGRKQEVQQFLGLRRVQTKPRHPVSKFVSVSEIIKYSWISYFETNDECISLCEISTNETA
jgi:hypothetical protein